MKQLNMILDTDLGSDCDDMMALTYLVYAAHHKGVRLCAITHSNGCPEGPDACRVFFEHLGERVPPIGRAPDGMKAYDHYCKELVAQFDRSKSHHEYADAVSVMRRALVENDHVVICAIGAMTNVAALLKSAPDGISSLDGVSLVREKCDRLILMAGSFDPAVERVEWNVHLDVAAARTVAEQSPVPVIWLPSETGADIMTGGPMMEAFGEGNPLSFSFCRFPGVLKKGGRPSWDPATVLYAVEGCGDIFRETPDGSVVVRDEGKTIYTPDGMKKHRILHLKDQEAIQKAAARIDQCATWVYRR